MNKLLILILENQIVSIQEIPEGATIISPSNLEPIIAYPANACLAVRDYVDSTEKLDDFILNQNL